MFGKPLMEIVKKRRMSALAKTFYYCTIEDTVQSGIPQIRAVDGNNVEHIEFVLVESNFCIPGIKAIILGYAEEAPVTVVIPDMKSQLNQLYWADLYSRSGGRISIMAYDRFGAIHEVKGWLSSPPARPTSGAKAATIKELEQPIEK